jgi:amino acid transporter
MALAATANTVLLLLASAARSIYGMASSGVLPWALGRIGETRIPTRATLLVVGIAAGLALIRDFSSVAALTNAAILASFILVNLSLGWLARRAGSRLRGTDLAVSAIALIICGWLFIHTGWVSILVAVLMAALGLMLGGRGNTPVDRTADRG